MIVVHVFMEFSCCLLWYVYACSWLNLSIVVHGEPAEDKCISILDCVSSSIKVLSMNDALIEVTAHNYDYAST